MKKFSGHKVRWGLLLAAVSLLLIIGLACSSEEAPAPTGLAPTAAPAPTTAPAAPVTGVRPQYGGTLRYALIQNCKGLDPAFAQSTCYKDISHAVFNHIVDADAEFKIVPELAKSWDFSADGKTLTFHLVQGAKFHDGTDVTAQSVKFHFDRVLDPEVGSPQAGDIKIIESTEVIDTYTVALHFKNPDRALLATLAGGYPGVIESPTAVLNANSYSDITGDFGRRPVGSGPFTLGEYTPDVRIVINRFDGYFEEGLPYLDGIEFMHVPDQTVRLAMMRTGDADLTGGGAAIIDARDAYSPQVKDNPNIKVVILPRSRMNSIGISTDVAPWDNKDLRAAIAYGIDRQTLADTYFSRGAVPAYSPIAIGWAYNPDIKIYDYNPTKAKEALAKAGYPNGIALKFWTNGTSAAVELAEIYQAMLKEVDINLDLQTVPAADYWQSIVQRKSHMAARWRGARPDPGRFIQQVFHSKGQGNVMGYVSADFGFDVDPLIDKAGAIYDIVEAKKIYDEIQRIVTEDVAHVITVYTQEFVIFNKDVEGYTFIPDLYHRLEKVWFKR